MHYVLAALHAQLFMMYENDTLACSTASATAVRMNMRMQCHCQWQWQCHWQLQLQTIEPPANSLPPVNVLQPECSQAT
jgi:hypothetical protein